MSVVERYCGAAGFLTSLGDSLQVYLENLAASFPNQQNLESSELYTFIQVSFTPACPASHLSGRNTPCSIRRSLRTSCWFLLAVLCSQHASHCVSIS